jgi:hypothetical protein
MLNIDCRKQKKHILTAKSGQQQYNAASGVKVSDTAKSGQQQYNAASGVKVSDTAKVKNIYLAYCNFDEGLNRM